MWSPCDSCSLASSAPLARGGSRRERSDSRCHAMKQSRWTRASPLGPFTSYSTSALPMGASQTAHGFPLPWPAHEWPFTGDNAPLARRARTMARSRSSSPPAPATANARFNPRRLAATRWRVSASSLSFSRTHVFERTSWSRAASTTAASASMAGSSRCPMERRRCWHTLVARARCTAPWPTWARPALVIEWHKRARACARASRPLVWRSVEGGPIPMAESGAGLVRALKELEDQFVRRGGRARHLVREDEVGQLPVVVGAPEEMHGAALAEESPLEPLHDPVGVGQHSKEPVGLPGIVRGVDAILEERDRMIDLHRHGPALHDDAEAGEDIRVLAVEVRDGL